ncbi:MAG: TolC family protein [Pirellulaceae bacterium]|nr:TolC family protein [Pirellulaceae bacterium]
MDRYLSEKSKANARLVATWILAACSGCASSRSFEHPQNASPARIILSVYQNDAHSEEAAASADGSRDVDDESRDVRDQTNASEDAPMNVYHVLAVETCVQIAIESHPKITAAQARVVAARSRIPQVKALPDPMLDNMFWPIQSNSLQTAGGRMQDQFSLTQQVPWPEKLRARAEIACREMQIAQAEVESLEREIAETVRLAYYEIWYADRGTNIVRENQKLVANLIKTAEARYKTGGSQQDVLNAEIERERLQQQLLEFSRERAIAETELATYLQQPQSLNIQTEAELPLKDLPKQLDILIATAEQCNPELRGLAMQIQRDIQKQRLAYLQRYPDLQFGTQYGFMSRGGALSPVADGNDMISFSVGVTLPVWRDKIRGGIDEAFAMRTNSAQLRQSEQLTIEGRLRRLLAEIDSLDQQRILYADRILPRSEQALNIAMSEYTVNKTTFVQLTENYQELLLFQLQIARLDATLASRLAQLQRTVGCPVEM